MLHVQIVFVLMVVGQIKGVIIPVVLSVYLTMIVLLVKPAAAADVHPPVEMETATQVMEKT